MITEEKQDLAVDYAFGMMDGASERVFEAEMKADEELRVFAMELREAAGAIAHDAPACLPPPELRERILSQARGELAMAETVAKVKASADSASATASIASDASTATQTIAHEQPSFRFLPWAIAAGLAITSVAMWLERDQWKAEALLLRDQAIALRTQDIFSQIKIATLTAQNEAYAKAGAVVVWDEAKQRGVVKLSNFPAAGNGKDYQLWVIDPKIAQPVSGGVVPVDANGVARVDFKPDQPIRKAGKFAISLEREGGAPQVAGPIILAGE